MKTVFLSICMLISLSVWSQQRPVRERVESERIAFYTKHMYLSPAEAKIFWPLHDVYQESMDEQRIERRQKQQDVRERLEEMSDEQINRLIDSRLEQAENALKARKLFISQLRKELPPVKVAKFFRAEELFQREMVNRARQATDNRRMPPR